MKLLAKSFYHRSTIDVAQELLGKKLIRIWNGKKLSGIISETEAYCGTNDLASHAFTKETRRNKAMFGPAGHSYVYFIYGNHHCLNIVAKEEGDMAGGVLIRGIIPIDGIETMHQLRNTDTVSNLTNGPGKIGQALNLNLSHNHIDITKPGKLYITEGIAISSQNVSATPRIGIQKAQEKLWRFVLNDAFGTFS